METVGEVEDQRQHDHTDDADQQPVHNPSSSPTTRTHNGRKSSTSRDYGLVDHAQSGPGEHLRTPCQPIRYGHARSGIGRLPETDPDASTARDGVERTPAVSLHAKRARVMIIMAKSATEMIFTPRWYTVAQLLNYVESKVRMLIIVGQLRSIKDGRSRRILTEWVEAYVQDRVEVAEDIW